MNSDPNTSHAPYSSQKMKELCEFFNDKDRRALRLDIAKHALIGILACPLTNDKEPAARIFTTTELARQAWEIADALLDTENPKP